MGSDENKQLYDRREVALDDKLRKLDLSKMNLVPPDVGICDPPLRVYPLNNEWAKIVMGLVSWLATIAPWRDAEDETYIGIQEVIQYMIGCDPCEALVTCIEGVIDTPPADWTPIQLEMYFAFKKITNKEGDTTYPITYITNPVVLEEGTGCAEGNLFAACTGLVDIAYTAIVDVLQKIDVFTNGLEGVGKILSAIPGLGSLPFDELFEIAENFFDNLYSNFLAYYTEPLRTKYRCDLFCLAKDDCYLDFQQVFAYFAGRAALSITTFDLTDVVEFIVAGTFSGDEIIHITHAFFFYCLAYDVAWDVYTTDFLINWTQSKFNDSDPDWAILCDCAPEPYGVYYYFPGNSPNGWTILAGEISGERLRSLAEGQPGGHHFEAERYFEGFDGLELLQYPNIVVDYVGQSNVNLHAYITHSGGQEYFDWRYDGPGSAGVEFDPPLDNVTYIKVYAREDLVADGGHVSTNGIYLGGASNDPPPESE